MDLNTLLRFSHLLSAIAFVGGLFARQVVRARAARVDDIERFSILSEAAGFIETRLVIPGNMAVMLFGVIYALRIKAPILGFVSGDSRNWLLAANVLLVLGLLMVPLYFLPSGRRFDAVLQTARNQGMMT